MLALDIDGTLLDSRGALPDANREAVRRARESGLDVVLATGRRFDSAAPIARMLGLDLPLILHNGALVKHALTEEVELHHPLDVDAARRAVRIIRRHGFDPVLHFGTRDRAHRLMIGPVQGEKSPWLADYLKVNQEFIHWVADTEMGIDEPPTAILVGGRGADVQTLAQDLRPALDGAAEVVLSVYSTLTYLDVIRVGLSKASALADFAAARGVRREEILAVGDNWNDLEMLQFAGQGVVMGNAPEGLRSLGLPVTGTCDEGGLAQALEWYVGK